MNLEPQVLDRIDREKRSAFAAQLRIAAFPLVLLGIAGIVTLLVYSGSTQEQASIVARSHISPVALVLIGALLLLVPTAVLLGVTMFQRNRFCSFIISRMWDNYDHDEMVRFNNGLDAVSLAVGIEAPELVVLELAGAGTTSFLFAGDRPHVAVSREALEVQFSDQEAEALMAHEVAHIIVGDIIKTPSALSPERLAMVLPLFIACIGLIAALVMGNATAIAFFFIAFLVFVAGALSSELFSALLGRLFKVKWRHDDILADSIASKITGNPDAFSRALVKLDRLGLTGTVVPALKFVRVRVNTEPQGFVFPKPFSRWLRTSDQTLDTDYKIITVDPTDEALIAEREQNLGEIKVGHWRAFDEVKRGRVRLIPARWE